MFRRKVALDSETEARLAECARRWGVSRDEAAQSALRFGLECLEPIKVPPDFVVGPTGGVQEKSGLKRLTDSLLVYAIQRNHASLRIVWKDGTLTAYSPGTGVSDQESRVLPAICDGTEDPDVIRWLSEGLWARLCYWAKLDFYTNPGTRRGQFQIEWDDRNFRIHCVLRISRTHQRTALLRIQAE